jgi:hypothetical protein
MRSPAFQDLMRSVLVGVLFWVVPVFAADKALDVLQFEVNQIQQEYDAIEKTSFASPEKQEALDELRPQLDLLKKRNAIFKARISSGNSCYHIYAANLSTAYKYLNEADAAYKKFCHLFKGYQFSNQYPIHVLVYPDRASYLHYEKMHRAVAGHAVSTRLTLQKYIETPRGLEVEDVIQPNSQLQRLAFYVAPSTDPNQHTFTHEIVHVFNWDMIHQNVDARNEIALNLFLNEGLAEYLATKDRPEQQELRLAPLRKLTQYAGPAQWIGSRGYPSFFTIREFYSEAYLFVRWLVEEQPLAGPRLKALLTARSDEDVEKMQRWLASNNIQRIDWKKYREFRDRILFPE